MDLEKKIQELRDADQTPAIVVALPQLIKLRAPLAAAEAELKAQSKEARLDSTRTTSEQKTINKPLVKDIEVKDEEIVEAKNSVSKLFSKKKK